LRDSARRVLGVDIPFEVPKGPGPHALRRINGQNTRIAEKKRGFIDPEFRMPVLGGRITRW